MSWCTAPLRVLVYIPHPQRGVYISTWLWARLFFPNRVYCVFDIVFHQRRYMAFHSVNWSRALLLLLHAGCAAQYSRTHSSVRSMPQVHYTQTCANKFCSNPTPHTSIDFIHRDDSSDMCVWLNAFCVYMKNHSLAKHFTLKQNLYW